MRPLLIPVACLAVFAARASAFPAQAPEVVERSENWGPQFRQRAERIFRCVLRASSYDEPIQLEKDGRKPTELRFTDKYLVVEGSPALALMARTGPNPADHSIVLATYGLFEFNNEDQLAYIFAHEISHLASEHPKRTIEAMRKLSDEKFDAWYEAKKAKFSRMKTEEVAEAFLKDHEAELAKTQVEFERAAEANGFNLMGLANRNCEDLTLPVVPFARVGAEESMARADKWLKARHMDGIDLTHDPLLVRSATLARYRQESEASAARARAAMGEPTP